MDYDVWVRGSDGKNYLISMNWLAQKLGVCKLKDRVKELEKPLRKKAINT